MTPTPPGLAEVLFGAAVGYKDVFYVTVSTGIGTGVIIDGKIYHGKNGIAGEGGHVSIDYHSPYRCGCGTYGCIEALAAGPGMARRARVMLEQEHSLPSLLRDLTHGHTGADFPAADSAGRAPGRPRRENHPRRYGFLPGRLAGRNDQPLRPRGHRDRRRRFPYRQAAV